MTADTWIGSTDGQRGFPQHITPEGEQLFGQLPLRLDQITTA